MPNIRTYAAIAGTVLLTACSTGANHLGNPLTWPMGALGTGLGNLAYGAERARVEAYVDAHFDTLVHEIGAGGGATLDDAFAVAGVPETAQADFIQHMQGYDLSQPDNLVVALMVHRA